MFGKLPCTTVSVCDYKNILYMDNCFCKPSELSLFALPIHRQTKLFNIMKDNKVDFHNIKNGKSYRVVNSDHLIEKQSPNRLPIQKCENFLPYFMLYFRDSKLYSESIQVNRDLYVKFFTNNSTVPLPAWFRDRHCQLIKSSMLENLATHLKN